MSEKFLPTITLLFVWVPYLLLWNNNFTEGLECYVCDFCQVPSAEDTQNCPWGGYCCKMTVSTVRGVKISRYCLPTICDTIMNMYTGLDPAATKTYGCRKDLCNSAAAFDMSPAAMAVAWSLMRFYVIC